MRRRAGKRPFLVVLRALGLGDLLTALPALRALAGAFPEHRRVLAAPAVLAPLALHAGAVDEVADVAALASLGPTRARPDVAVNLHGRGAESHGVLLATRPRRLVSFAHPDVPASAASPVWRPDEHEVERWCRLLAESGIPADPRRLDLLAPKACLSASHRGATVVHPGAASPARRWPAERFAAVARSELEAGRRVVVTGSREEVFLARRVARHAGIDPDDVLAGRTSLLALAALVATARVVVCGDTGIGHLATALGTRSVLLFGPTSPDRWGPPAGRSEHVVLWSGKTGDPHGTSPDPGLLEIDVDDVRAALS